MEKWYVRIRGTLGEANWALAWSEEKKNWVPPYEPPMTLFDTEKEARIRALTLIIAPLPESHPPCVELEIVKCLP